MANCKLLKNSHFIPQTFFARLKMRQEFYAKQIIQQRFIGLTNPGCRKVLEYVHELRECSIDYLA